MAYITIFLFNLLQLPDKELHLLSNSRNKDIRDLATELCIDLNY